MKKNYLTQNTSFIRKIKLIFILFTVVFLNSSYIQGQTIFSENFESVATTAVLPNGGWSSFDVTAGNSMWGNGVSGCVITGTKSMFVCRASIANLCDYAPSSTTNRIAYKTFSAAGFNTLLLSFKWKCNGEFINPTYFDYGKVCYSTNGTTWTDLPTIYQGQTTTQTVTNLALPAALDGLPTVYLGFRWVNDISTKNIPGFVIDDITITATPVGGPPCVTPANSPTALNYSGTTSTASNGSFTAAVGSPDGYLVVRSNGALSLNPSDGVTYSAGNTIGNGTVIQSSSSVTFSLTGLTGNTSYTSTVFSNNNVCTGGPLYKVSSPLTGVVTTCPAVPGTPTASGITSSSFNLSWLGSAGGGASLVNYTIDISTNNTFTLPIPGSPFTVNDPTVTLNLSGLTPSTQYFYRIKANGACSSSYTTTASATTLCPSVTSLPLIEGFEATTLPPCWSTALITSTQNWASETSSDGVPSPHTGSRFAGKDWNGVASDALLISPPINLAAQPTQGARINVWIHRNDLGVANDRVRFYVNTAPNKTGATNLLDIQTLYTNTPPVASAGWYNYMANIPLSFNTGGIFYIVAEGVTTANINSYSVGFDDFIIENIPPCLPPSALTASSVTSSGATISWTAPAPPPGTGYEYVVSTSNVTPVGSGIAVASNSTGITGLSPNTSYYLFVRSICGGANGNSSWIGPYNFVTPCVAISVLPYNEGFETSPIPSCWSTALVTGTTNWLDETDNDGVPSPHSGTLFAGKDWDASASDALLISPPFNLTSQPTQVTRINVWIHRNDLGVANDRVRFFVNNAPNKTGATTLLDIQALYTNSPVVATPGWYNYVANIPLSYNTGGNFYIIAEGITTASINSYSVGVDDFILENLPSCFPPTALNATFITTSSAVVGWTAAVPAPLNGYEYVVSTSNIPPAGSGIAVTGTSASVSSLLPSTAYYLFVRSICGAGDGNSTWAGPYTFTTLCTNSVLPLTEGFNSTTIPACWSQQSLIGSDLLEFVPSSSFPTTTPQEGSDFILYSSFDFDDGNETRLVSAPISTVGAAAVGINFYWYNENSTSYNSGAYLNEGTTLQYSFNGTTWLDVQFYPRQDASLASGTGQWKLKSVILPAGFANQPLVFVGFKFHSAFGDNCSLDNITLLALTPCSGQPAASTTVSSVSNPVCNGTPFTLSLGTDYSAIPAIGYQWQSAPDIGGFPGAFTNVATSGNSANYIASQLSASWYHCIITCTNGNQSVTSNDFLATAQACYCIPTYNGGCSNGDMITNLTLNTLSNNSGTACVSSPPGYIVYGAAPANLTTTLLQGINYTATITVATGNANGTGVAAWIDFNDNGVYEATENFNNGATKFASNTTGTLAINIPGNATPGIHRMRFRSMRNTLSNAIDPCILQNSNGEAEDYLVTVAQPAASATGSICEGGAIVLNATPSGATSYTWSGPNGFGSTLQNPTIPVSTMADTGDYTVSIVIGSTTYTPTVHVSLFRSPAPYIFPNDTFLCSGSIITVEAKDLYAFSAGWPSGTLFDFGFGPFPDSAFLVNGPGTYSVTVTIPVTSGGCSAASENADIFYRDSPVLLLNSDPVKCHGTNTGYVSAQVFLGSAPYRFVYFNSTGSVVRDVTTGFPADTLFNVGAGEYCVIAYDTATAIYPPPSCRSDSTCIIVTEPTLLAASETHGSILCHGGTTSVSISASGGTPPYSGTGNFLQSAGLSTYEVTDANGCIASVSLTLAQPSLLSVALTVTENTCSYLTGSIAGLVSGGTSSYQFAWSNGTTLSSVLSAPGGTYTITVTDLNGCSATSSAVIIAPGPVALTGSQVNLLCRGVSSGAINPIVAGGTGPYNFLWNNGNTASSRSSLAAGTYTVTVTDAAGCTKTKTWTITQPATNLLMNTTQTNVRCYGGNGGVATVSPSGGTSPYTYSWNTFPVQTTATVIGLLAGVYTCNVTDAIGCSKNIVITITQPADINVFQSQLNVTFPGGNNGSATVLVTGGTPGYAYSWNTAPVKTTATATGLTAGTYKCTITDTKGCSKKVTFIITEPIAREQVNAADWSINCYPNPTAGLMVISFEQAESGWFRLELTDYTGRILISNDRHAAQGLNEFAYDFTNLSKGIYFIRLSENDRNKTIRIVIQ